MSPLENLSSTADTEAVQWSSYRYSNGISWRHGECNKGGSPGHKIISKNENAQACAPVTPENTKQIVGDIGFYHLTFQLLSASGVRGAS